MTHPDNSYPLVDGRLDPVQEKRAQARQASAFVRGEASELPEFATKGRTAVEDGRISNGLPADKPLPTVLDRNLEAAQQSVVQDDEPAAEEQEVTPEPPVQEQAPADDTPSSDPSDDNPQQED